MREGNALQVFYDEKLVGTLAMTADRKAAFQYSEEWIENGFRSVRFHFPLKSRFLYRQKIILTDYLEYLQIVCRIIGGDCCWIVCYVHISRIQTN